MPSGPTVKMKRKLDAEASVMSTQAVSELDHDKSIDHSSSDKGFAGLGLDARILQAVNLLKFSAPTPVQSKAIPFALQGKDVLARARTGSGKTLAYVLPVFHAILTRKAADKRAKAITALILVPTKELASQVTSTIARLSKHCAQLVSVENITRKEDVAVTRARLANVPDIVVATPTRAQQSINEETLKLESLTQLVIDEADLILSFEHGDDLQHIADSLPPGVQRIMMSATLRTDIDTLSTLFFSKDEQKSPVLLDLSTEEAAEQKTLAQYKLRTAEDEKFLLIYAIFKLQLIKGKVIMFVADIDRCYRTKLFLEQFGIRSCVLNSELPVNSRLHAVQEFNRGVYDIIIAADDAEIIGHGEGKRKKRNVQQNQSEVDVDLDQKEDADTPLTSTTNAAAERPTTRRREDREFGISRGIDFRHVTCVLNFDLPPDAKSYTHRIGRTARAGQAGMALSLYVPREHYRKHKPTSIPQCEHDEDVLAEIVASQTEAGHDISEWGLDWEKLSSFRYRLADALRSVTRIAVREARTTELRNELLKSEKLKRHFEENPDDLSHLRHDTETHAIRQQPHLRHVPEYLLPAGGKAAVGKDVGFVGIRKDPNSVNRIRKARAVNKGRGKGRLAERKRRGGGDPLKTFNAMGRKKK